mgnify:CR=1 FL=1
MEMINGEKKLHVWLYKYEQDGVSPVFEVDGSRQEVEYTINNSVDSLYTFCKLEFADDSSEECEVADIYTLEVPGDAENPQMNLRVFTAENSPFIDVLVTNDQKEKIRKTAQAILNARALYTDSNLADLYDPLTMPTELLKAHKANNRAVMHAYGFSIKMSEADCVAELMRMYQKLTKEK